MGARVFSDRDATHALRELGLEHLHRRMPKTFTQWKRDVRADYGTVDERRLYRILAWLVRQGLVAKSAEMILVDDHEGEGSFAFEYRRLGSAVPVLDPHYRCSLCGSLGVTMKSHIAGSARLHRWFRHVATRRQNRSRRNGARPADYEAIEFGYPTRSARAPAALTASKETRPRAWSAGGAAHQAA